MLRPRWEDGPEDPEDEDEKEPECDEEPEPTNRALSECEWAEECGVTP